MVAAKKKTLKRPRHPMPFFVRKALNDRGLMAAYKTRPPYQQNDYNGWITRAKLDSTKEKRLAQMLDELERGDAYMKMVYRPRGAGRDKEELCANKHTLRTNSKKMALKKEPDARSKSADKSRE